MKKTLTRGHLTYVVQRLTPKTGGVTVYGVFLDTRQVGFIKRNHRKPKSDYPLQRGEQPWNPFVGRYSPGIGGPSPLYLGAFYADEGGANAALARVVTTFEHAAELARQEHPDGERWRAALQHLPWQTVRIAFLYVPTQEAYAAFMGRSIWNGAWRRLVQGRLFESKERCLDYFAGMAQHAAPWERWELETDNQKVAAGLYLPLPEGQDARTDP